jgi:hypothetical protein
MQASGTIGMVAAIGMSIEIRSDSSLEHSDADESFRLYENDSEARCG